MKKIIIFYLLCFLSIVLLWLITNDTTRGSRDFKFGFNVVCFFTLVFYAPLFTFSASMLYYFKINRTILTNKIIGVFYCIFPFLLTEIIRKICYYADITVDYTLENCTPITYIVQNFLIIIYWMIRRKQRNQN